MRLRQIIAIVAGVGIVGLLSSIFAVLQGRVYPEANENFNQAMVNHPDAIQLIIKLACIYLSSIISGVVTTSISGNLRENLVVGVVTITIIGWLWINAINPAWFWALLMVGIIPSILLGYKLTCSYRARGM